MGRYSDEVVRQGEAFEDTYEAGAYRAALQGKADLAEALAVLGQAVEALKAVHMMRDQGPKPQKLDAALSWRENDEKAEAMYEAAISAAEPLLRPRGVK